MIRTRFIIPLVFGVLALLLALFGFSQRKAKTILQATGVMNPGESRVFTGLKLVEGRHYKLIIGSTSAIPLGRTGAVGATLIDDEETEIFSVEDNYWHERGTWHEDGESGTWDEANAVTEFDFRPPLTGEYSLRIDLFTVSVGGMSLGFRVEESQPFRLAEWPLLIAAFVLFAFAGFTFYSRGNFLAGILKDLGVGTKLKIQDVDYDVVRVFHYKEGFDDVGGVELELAGSGGQRRYLAIETFEREYQDSEGDDHTAMHKQILLDEPLPENQLDYIESQDVNHQGPYSVTFRGELYQFDADNSGAGLMLDKTAGNRLHFRSQMYRTAVFPRRPGNFWLERISYTESGEVEWGVMRIMSPDEIEIVKAAIHQDQLQLPA